MSLVCAGYSPRRIETFHFAALALAATLGACGSTTGNATAPPVDAGDDSTGPGDDSGGGGDGGSGGGGSARPDGGAAGLPGAWQPERGAFGLSDVTAIGGTAANNVWFADAYGQIFSFDGTSIALEFKDPSLSGWTSICAVRSGDIWFAGDKGQVSVLQGTSLIPLDPLTSSDVLAVWGTSSRAMWISYFSITDVPEVAFWDGSMFHSEARFNLSAAGSTVTVKSLWGTAINDVWGAGGKGVWHWNGLTWTSEEFPIDGGVGLFGVSGTATDDVWAVGDRSVFHYDGNKWTRVTTPVMATNTFTAVWAAARDDVWIVGLDGVILHWNGHQLTRVPSGTTRALYSVWGTGPLNVWAGGAENTLLHYQAGNTVPSDPKPACSGAGDSCAMSECCGALRCYRLNASILACG